MRQRALVPLALHALAQQLAVAADSLGFFAGAALGRLFVVPPELHFPEYPFALHFLLEGSESLIDVVVANKDLHGRVTPQLDLKGLPSYHHPPDL